MIYDDYILSRPYFSFIFFPISEIRHENSSKSEIFLTTICCQNFTGYQSIEFHESTIRLYLLYRDADIREMWINE